MADNKRPESSGSAWEDFQNFTNRGVGYAYKGAGDDTARRLMNIGAPKELADLVREYVMLTNEGRSVDENGKEHQHWFGGNKASREGLAQSILDMVRQLMNGVQPSYLSKESVTGSTDADGNKIRADVVSWKQYLGALKTFNPDDLYVSGMYPLPVPRKGNTSSDMDQTADTIKVWVREILSWDDKLGTWSTHAKKKTAGDDATGMSAALDRMSASLSGLDSGALKVPEVAVQNLEPIIKNCYSMAQNGDIGGELKQRVESRLEAMREFIDRDTDHYAIRFVGYVLTNKQTYPYTLGWLNDCGLPTDGTMLSALMDVYNRGNFASFGGN